MVIVGPTRQNSRFSNAQSGKQQQRHRQTAEEKPLPITAFNPFLDRERSIRRGVTDFTIKKNRRLPSFQRQSRICRLSPARRASDEYRAVASAALGIAAVMYGYYNLSRAVHIQESDQCFSALRHRPGP